MKTAFDDYFASLQGKTVAVLGLGVSNRPLVKLLLEQGLLVIGCDKTPREKLDEEVLELEMLGCRLHVGENYLQDIQADVAFRTPGMHPENPALVRLRGQGTQITSEMEVFFEVCPCRIIAVTGSDGKTTTTTLISEILKAGGNTVWLGGNIGKPLLADTPKMNPRDYAVVELSSFQLMDMRRSPHVAVVTNLAPNHLDVHRDMAEYVEAKKNIFRFQGKRDILIANADNDITASFQGVGTTKWFSRRHPVRGAWTENGVIFRDGVPVLNTKEILIPGVHNIENFMAAILAVEGIASDADIRHVARSFTGVEHRIELVRIKDGVRFYNDSIASSPSRTIAGLRSFSQPVILIAGGYDKHIPYDVLGPEICDHVKKLFLNGATAGKIRAAVEASPSYRPGHPQIVECPNLAGAVEAAAKAASPGDTVLLSPASAAFDQFQNFMVRGNFFKKMIMEL